MRGKLVDKYRNKLRQNKRLLTFTSEISDITSSTTDLESDASSLDGKHLKFIYFLYYYI